MERYIGRLLPGQEVCDVNGEKVGTISHVYREDVAPPDSGTALNEDEVIEVKTGFLGLGQKLYVPVSAVQDTTDAAVFVDKPADQFDSTWKEKPDRLERMT